MGYRDFTGVSDVRDATVAAILDQASPDEMTPDRLVSAAAAYGIVLTREDADDRIYTHTARHGQLAHREEDDEVR